MDLISVFGLLLGLSAILGGQFLEGGHLSSLVQPTAFLIVIGGTVGAVMLQSPFRVFARGVAMVRWVFFHPHINYETTIAYFVDWAQIARREGLLALESRISMTEDAFIQRGLQYLVDGSDPERMRDVLEVEISAWERSLKQSARIWESAGGYSPTIGILGAVMGLIHVMENLTDPSKLGSGIAVAFVATIYGVGTANLIFLPISKKLLEIINKMVLFREMVVDGLVSIANGENQHIVESRLRGHLGEEGYYANETPQS